MLSRKRRSVCTSIFKEDDFPLAQQFWGFHFWLQVIDSADCWKLQLVTPYSPPP